MISLSDFFTIPPSDSLGRGQRPRANPRRDLTFRTDTTAHNNLPNREISCPQEGKWRVRLQGSWTVRCHRHRVGASSGPRSPWRVHEGGAHTALETSRAS